MAPDRQTLRAGFPVPAHATLPISVLCADSGDFRVRRLLALATDELSPVVDAHCHTDVVSCIQALSQAGPSICLVDDAVGLPSVSQTIHGLRDSNRECACIVVTERMDPELHARYLDYGAGDVLLWQDTVDPDRAGFNIFRSFRGALTRALLDTEVTSLRQRFDFSWRDSPSPFFRVDGQGQLIQCNQAFAELLGCEEPSNLEGRPLLEMAEGPDANVFPFVPTESTRGRTAFLRDKDGDPVRVELFDHEAPGVERELRRLVALGGPRYHLPVREGFARPLGSVEKKLRERASRYESMYNSLFAGMAEGFVLADARGLISAANPSAERTLGLRLADIHGQHLDVVMSPMSCDDPNVRAFSNIFDGRERVFELARTVNSTVAGMDAETEPVWVRCKACLIGIPGATSAIRRSQFLISVIDITEQIKAERKASEAELGTQLVQGVSHDMRNYLTAISSSASLMMRLLKNEDATLFEYAQQIEQVAMSSAGLLDQGLRAAKPSQVAKPRLVPLDAAVAGIRLLLRSLCAKRVNLEIKLGTDQSTILGEKRAIEQVVINLVLNATQALQDQGNVTVETSTVELDVNNRFGIAAGRTLLLTVHDDGPGIAPEIKRRMFEPFFTGRAEGSGLGLAMVRELVHELRGRIVCDTEMGEGTTFTVALPFDDKGAPMATGPVPLVEMA